MKGLTVDLVILNEDISVYHQSLHDQIVSLIASGIEAQMLDKPGGIFVRRLEQISNDDRVSCNRGPDCSGDENGPLEQLDSRESLSRRSRLTPIRSAFAIRPPPLP
jgi:hypothetical protein